MVFPRPRCLTCKKRRVKCDSGRPTCTPCRRGCRSCTWDSNEEIASPFRNENAFARGLPRRSRKKLGNEGPRDAMLATTPFTSPPPSLFLPLEHHAFCFFAENFTIFPGHMPEIGCGYLTYALDYWNHAQQDSGLRLALLAFSLAAFGQVNRMSRALDEADRFYIKSVAQMQREIEDLPNERTDQLIVATLLMTNYETYTYKAKDQFSHSKMPPSNETGSRLWRFARHWEGAAGLLLVRQQWGLPLNLPICRAARRPMIRGYILRGEPVPSWLQDGAQFGEEGPTLRLDSLMVRTASVRADYLKLLLCGHKATSSPSVGDLAATVTDLDVDLASWCLGLAEEWNYSIRMPVELLEATASAFLYDAAIYDYATLGHATVWIRYLAVRLVVTSIRMRLFGMLAKVVPQAQTFEAVQATFQENIASFAVDICRSVPFFFDIGAMSDEPISGFTGVDNNPTPAEPTISPRVAILLAWPLAVVFSTEAVPMAQKQWLQRVLKIVARVQGDVVLQTIAENEEFKF